MKKAFLGIDIAKNKFDVALLSDDKYKTKKFNNSKSGLNSLIDWVSSKNVTIEIACMEATGSYSDCLAEYLFEKNIHVSVVNPVRISGFSKSKLSRNKTDTLDAKLIAEFAKCMLPEKWIHTPKHIRTLQAYTRRIDDLIKMHRQEKNRLDVACEELKSSINKNVVMFDEQIKELKKLIKEHINNHPDLKSKDKLLQSIPAVGDTVSAIIMSFLSDLSKFSSAKQITAFVGLNPKQIQSGASVNGRTRLSKTGHREIRKNLYMPALSAIRFNPMIKKFYNNLLSRGKSKMCAIGAVMRKMLHIIYGVLKSGKEFDENYLPIKC